mmetsp:Transcript_28589/g.54636  ORF Transcript_28589/g.54636 Transcript_28589/m.54636 type:complete len:204 (-) Transcript_28589:979-1590(-)
MACLVRVSTTSLMLLRIICSSLPRHSMSSAAASSSQPGRPLTSFTMPSFALHSRRHALSNISTASTPVSLRRTYAALHASSTVGNMMNEEALWWYSGTVLYVARDTNASVPSEPIIRRLMISIGSCKGKSTMAFKLYPVVHLIANFLRMSAVSCLSAWMRAASATTPSTSVLWVLRKEARLSGQAVSSTVPSTRTMRRSRTVW